MKVLKLQTINKTLINKFREVLLQINLLILSLLFYTFILKLFLDIWDCVLLIIQKVKVFKFLPLIFLSNSFFLYLSYPLFLFKTFDLFNRIPLKCSILFQLLFERTKIKRFYTKVCIFRNKRYHLDHH